MRCNGARGCRRQKYQFGLARRRLEDVPIVTDERDEEAMGACEADEELVDGA